MSVDLIIYFGWLISQSTRDITTPTTHLTTHTIIIFHHHMARAFPCEYFVICDGCPSNCALLLHSVMYMCAVSPDVDRWIERQDRTRHAGRTHRGRQKRPNTARRSFLHDAGSCPGLGARRDMILPGLRCTRVEDRSSSKARRERRGWVWMRAGQTGEERVGVDACRANARQ